jgi:hypothetical protein
MMKRHLFKLKSFYATLAISALLLASFVSTTYAWFTSDRTASASFTGMSVRGDGISALNWKLFRNDGAYIDDGVNYDATGSSMSSFDMNQFDPLIPDKNGVANLVFEAVITLEESKNYDNYHFLVTIATSNATFGTHSGSGTDSVYNLSDVLYYQGLSNITITDSDVFKSAETPFASASKSTFIVDDTAETYTKNSPIQFSLPIKNDSTTSNVYINFNYEETLIKKLYTSATGNDADSYFGGSVNLQCDFSFYVQLMEGVAS